MHISPRPGVGGRGGNLEELRFGLRASVTWTTAEQGRKGEDELWGMDLANL